MATGVSLSNYYENKIIDHMFRGQAFTPPATVYLALFTVAPGETGGGTEVSGGGYARKPVTFSAASAGSTSNSSDIDFGTATANWGTIVAVGLFDAATGGNLLAYGSLTSSKTVNSGDGFKILATKLTLTLD
jgi:hypothetical protein